MGARLLATAVVLGLIIALLWFKAPQVPNLVGQTEEMAKELAGNDFKIQVMFATPESVSTLKDAVVEVDAAETSGASMKMADHMTGHEAAPSHEGDNSQEAGHSHWGIICRRSSGDFYSMGILGDGRSFILKTKGGSTSSLAEGNPSEALSKGSEINHIRGDCVGSTLTLYANDQQILTAEDEGFGSGQVALLVSNRGSVSSKGTEVSSDNFSVIKP